MTLPEGGGREDDGAFIVKRRGVLQGVAEEWGSGSFRCLLIQERLPSTCWQELPEPGKGLTAKIAFQALPRRPEAKLLRSHSPHYSSYPASIRSERGGNGLQLEPQEQSGSLHNLV